MSNHPCKQEFSTALEESTGLSLIYKRVWYTSFWILLHHKFMKVWSTHLKACINLHVGITITFLGHHHKHCSTLCYLTPHPLKPKDFSMQKVSLWYDTASTPFLTRTSAERAHSVLSAATVKHALKTESERECYWKINCILTGKITN